MSLVPLALPGRRSPALPPRRRAFRLWLPVTPLAALAAPFVLVALTLFQGPLRRRGYSPWRAAFALAALIAALSGTLIEIDRPAVRLRIAIF